jgi:type VI secretion system protein ImpJ
MKLLSRVVWSEGMHLAQHHFQAQNRYVEDLLSFTVAGLFFEPYGVAGLELDPEALLNGTVSVIHARGIMPDGLAFQFPEDPLPAPLEIRDLFSPTQESHLVVLAIERLRLGQANCGPGGNGAAPTRFSAATHAIRDETGGHDEKPVELARKNFRLLLDTQLADGAECLPLARVRRDGSGHFVYDPAYVPPCVRIGASASLMQRLGRLVERLQSKADALLAQRQTTRSGLEEYAAREVADFWLSHTVHSSLPPLRHLFATRSCHPEVLYSELSRLAGALCTFALGSSPRTLPRYAHDDLGGCFAELERHVLEHLEVVLPTSSIAVALSPATAEQLEEGSGSLDAQALEAYREFLVSNSSHFLLGATDDGRVYHRAQWYLGVRSPAAQGEVIARVPSLVKVCSARHIARLVKDAYPGLVLEHVPSPPPQISPRSGTVYFRVQTAGPCWNLITQTRSVGVYVPASIPEAQLELSVVPEP